MFGSPVRRPPPDHDGDESTILDPNEALLDEFYSEKQPSHRVSLGGSPAPINPLVEEFDAGQRGNNASSFRRRRGEINEGPRGNGYSSVGNGGVSEASNGFNGHHNTTRAPSDMHGHRKRHPTWNRLNAALFVGQALLSAATSAPITLVPSMALSLAAAEDEQYDYSPYYNLELLEVYDENGRRKRWVPFRIRKRKNEDQNVSSSSIFASHLTSVVTLVTAFGKFVNGVLVDVAGARRLLLLYGMCTCLALMGLRYSNTTGWAIACCAAVEFFSSINWPAGVVILGAHYGTNLNEADGRFERGLYVTSLASRCGSLLAIPFTSLLIKWTAITWRGIAGLAACAALAGVAVFYFYLTDSPGKVHDPQNPIRATPQSSGSGSSPYHPTFNSWSAPQQSASQRALDFWASFTRTVLPSIKAILASRVFWAVAAAHVGATMVKSSERIMGTYFRDTSFGVVSESKAGAMTVFLSVGMLGGLLVGGRAFAKAADSEQGRHRVHGQSHLIDGAQLGTKNMVAFLYCLSICMCYMLSFFAMPFVRRALHLPVLVLILQVLATLGLGFGVAVQYYHIPAIVAGTYGKNRGLYTAYTDGVAALLSSIVWRIVGGAVEEGNPQGGGWAYGWAAVALLLVFCGTLMTKIVELYLMGWRHGTPTDRDQAGFPKDIPMDPNHSWMDEEMSYAGLSIESTPLRKQSLNILSTSALDYIGSPGRMQGDRKRLPPIVDSRDEYDTADANNVDLLGIDDDGSLLFPSMTAEGQNPGTQDDFISFNSMLPSKKELRDNESCIRESSVFEDPNESSFEL